MSSSSFDEGPACRLLSSAFDALRREAPLHHAALCERLSTLPVNIEVPDEHLAPRVVEGVLSLSRSAGVPKVVVRTSLAATYRLLDGGRTLVASIEAGELDVRGSADALDAAADAFSMFLHGLARAPSGAGLFDELRRHVATSGR